MPIAELGYRSWEGKRVPGFWRWLAITRNGVQVTYRGSKFLRRILFFAWTPLIFFGLLFFAVGWATDPASDFESGHFFHGLLRDFIPEPLMKQLRSNPHAFLPAIWSGFFYVYLASVQSVLAMLVIATVGPPLIARDVRNRAFLLYFSKPISPFEYILGKLSVLVFYLGLITFLPAMVLYLVSILCSPPGGTLLVTILIPGKIFLASLAIAIPTSLIMLTFSSFSKHTRIALFLWIAFWVFGEIAAGILASGEIFDEDQGAAPPETVAVSIRGVTQELTGAVFGVSGEIGTVVKALKQDGKDDVKKQLEQMARNRDMPAVVRRSVRDALGLPAERSPTRHALLYTVIVSAVCLFILHRRITGPIRA